MMAKRPIKRPTKPRPERFVDNGEDMTLTDQSGRIIGPSPKNAPNIPNESA